MCVATALAIGGTAMSVIGNIRQGNAAGEAAGYRAQVARNQAMLEESNAKMEEQNAVMAEQASERAIAAGSAKAENVGLKTGARVGAIKTAQAAGGVDVNTGSAVDVQAGTRMMGRLDAETVMANAALESYGFRVKANDARYRAEVSRFRGATGLQGASYLDKAGQDARVGGYLNALGSLASSASQLPTGWLGGGGGTFNDTSYDGAGGLGKTASGNTFG